MNWIVTQVQRLLGRDDVVLDDPFSSAKKNNLVRVRVAVGAATITGLAIVIVAILTSTLSSVGNHVEVPLDLTATPSVSSDKATSPLGSVLIHVIGEVNSPGIYELESGSRVIDAVMAAGGLRQSASDCGVNLAREVNDGEQILIPSQQQACLGGTGQAVNTELSLNQATAEQFDSLPGIGPTLAGRIVQWRESNGGFSSLDQLNEVSGIGDKLFAGLKDLVTL
jgi:competence protein ComEA